LKPTLQQLNKARLPFRMWLLKPNIVGLYIGKKTVGGEVTDELSLIICVEEKRNYDELGPGDFTIPDTVIFKITKDGEVSESYDVQVKTDVIQTGKAACQAGPVAEGGSAIYNSDGGCGTWGVTMPYPNPDSPPALICCNHATAKNGTTDKIIYYPGPQDRYVGETGFIPINTYSQQQAEQHPDWQDQFWKTVYNRYDFAYAYVADKQVQTMCIDGKTVGMPAAPRVGDKILIYGSASGAKAATIVSCNFDFIIGLSWGGLKAVFIEGIKLDKDISQGGDSGALMVREDDDMNIIGMLTGAFPNDASFGTWFPGVPSPT